MTTASDKQESKLVVDTLNQLFSQNKQLADKKESFQRKQNVNKRELEVALTVLLVDLASCDQNFDPEEYTMIQQGLTRIFGTSKDQVSALVNQANTALSNLRGSSSYLKLLNENLSSDEKKAVLCIIDQVIGADGVEDGFEVYLRTKFKDMLGISEAV